MTDPRSAAQIFADIFGPAPTERERSLIVRVALPCERSIIALRSANLAERTGQKIVLQRQLSDLGMEHRQVRRRSGTLATRLAATKRRSGDRRGYLHRDRSQESIWAVS